MKAISLWQPWASLWLSPAKLHETRHWPTSHRGPLLVHASKTFKRNLDDDSLEIILKSEFGPHWRIDLPTGALIGIVSIVNCYRSEDLLAHWRRHCPHGPIPIIYWEDYQCGYFADGRFAWQRGETFRRFAKPIPYRGAQGLFTVPDSVIASDDIAEIAA